MHRIPSTGLPSRVGERVSIAGWVHRRRMLKSVTFLILRDAAGLAQVVVTQPALRAQVAALTEESVIRVDGTVTANPAAPAGVEVVPAGILVLAEAEPAPFDLFRPTLTATLPTMLDHAALSLRHPSRRDAFRISAAAVYGFRSTLDEAGFVEVHTPQDR